jgi:hypothetical protein
VEEASDHFRELDERPVAPGSNFFPAREDSHSGDPFPRGFWNLESGIWPCGSAALFHNDVPVDFILNTFDVMPPADWHNFQVLTKRSERLLELSPILGSVLV